ncbi:MAG: hypothetical protein VR72_01855 [Clostridiaceae bacterium BRH_c20a]|nr:MAG: hypothetical protein VR72_01855 [Clostridiaceae bacterium BRH_c20a]
MKTKKIFTAICIILILQFALVSTVSAHIDTNDKWSSNRVYFKPVYAGSDANNRIREAASDWNSKVPGFTFSESSSSFHQLGPDPGGMVPYGVAAATYYWVNPNTGYIEECDVYYSTSLSWHYGTSSPPSDKFDFLTVTKHEFGHWYSLDDCYESSHSSSLMYYHIDVGQRKSISSHDYNPARIMYP